VFLLSTNEFEFGQIGAARDYLPVLAVTGGRIRHRDRQLLRPVGESSAAETPDKRRYRTYEFHANNFALTCMLVLRK